MELPQDSSPFEILGHIGSGDGGDHLKAPIAEYDNLFHA